MLVGLVRVGLVLPLMLLFLGLLVGSSCRV